MIDLIICDTIISMKSKKTLRVIDLFAGVGGFRVGLEKRANKKLKTTAFEFVWGNQWEPGIKTQHAADIYKKRFHTNEKDFVNDDINNVLIKDIPDHDLLVAGFPCQDYSVATTIKNSRGIEGKKGVLWWQIERIIREKGKKSPNYLILENVDRILVSPASQRGRDFAIILTCLSHLGYAVEWRVIDASEYGFPQRRKRTFIIAYKKGTKLYDIVKVSLDWLNKEGVIVKAFPVKRDNSQKCTEFSLTQEFNTKSDYYENISYISKNFNKNIKKSPFLTSGVMKKGKILTTTAVVNYKGSYKYLGNILLDDSLVEEDYFIPKSELDTWKYLKGAKKEPRLSKEGYKYIYTEGAVTFPDKLDKPSRTIITGEGGKAPSRFKHVIKTKMGKFRRLTPVELERLDMFPDNFTEGCSASKRAFLMGNALVVGVVEKLGESLFKSILDS